MIMLMIGLLSTVGAGGCVVAGCGGTEAAGSGAGALTCTGGTGVAGCGCATVDNAVVVAGGG